jgi:hypothetical protein
MVLPNKIAPAPNGTRGTSPASSAGTSKAANTTDDRAVSLAEYEVHMHRALAADNWFAFRRDYVVAGLLTKIEALFLADPISLAGAPKTPRKKIDGKVFFRCTGKKLKRSLAWDSDAQTRYLGALRQKGFVETVRLGAPSRRWVYLDLAAVEDALGATTGERS